MSDAIARRAARGAHVLIVEVPGWGETRMLLEAELDRRGWVSALSPVDADILAVCGVPGNEFQTVCDRVWDQLPGPRARVRVITAAMVANSLDAAAANLTDDPRQRQDARDRARTGAQSTTDADEQAGHDGMNHEMEMSEGSDDGGSHQSGMDHSGMEGMDHGGMDMPMPGGIPLAGGGDDRDGLEMDVLNVPLGPVLPHWPAGLVVDCVLQGDVIVDADVRILGAGSPERESRDREPDGDGRRWGVIRRCDLAAQLLALAGWQAAAQDARRLRDVVLQGSDMSDQALALDRLRRRVERSLLLRWSLKGIGAGDGDIRSRLIGWLCEASESSRMGEGSLGAARAAGELPDALPGLAALPDLIRGADLGTARLLIAGLGLDTAAVAVASGHPHNQAEYGTAHG